MNTVRNNGEQTSESQQNPPKRGSTLVSVAKLALAAILIYYLVRRGDIEPSQLTGAIGAHWVLTCVALFLMALSYLGQGYRWNVILRDREIRVPYWQAFRYLMIGKFFNLAVPGYFSEDFVRAVYLIRQNLASRSRVAMTLLADRLVGTMSLFLVGAAGLIARSLSSDAGDARLASLRTLTLVVTTGCVAGTLVVRRFPRAPRLLRRFAEKVRAIHVLDSVYAELHYYCCSPRLQLKVLGISLVNHAMMVSCFAVFGYALGMRVRPADYCIFVPLGILVTMIPVAPVGLGIGNIAFLTLFKMAGSDQGANLFLLYTAAAVLMSLVGGLFYLGVGQSHSRAAVAAQGGQ